MRKGLFLLALGAGLGFLAAKYEDEIKKGCKKVCSCCGKEEDKCCCGEECTCGEECDCDENCDCGCQDEKTKNQCCCETKVDIQ